MGTIDRYKTRERAQKPSRVMLIDPATGKETEDWLEIRSSLSDEFLDARDSTMQEVQSLTEPNPDKRKAAVKELQLKMKAALVAAWSFDEPFNERNVIEFLREAPQLQQMVLTVADDSARFFAKPSDASKSGQPKK